MKRIRIAWHDKSTLTPAYTEHTMWKNDTKENRKHFETLVERFDIKYDGYIHYIEEEKETNENG